MSGTEARRKPFPPPTVKSLIIRTREAGLRPVLKPHDSDTVNLSVSGKPVLRPVATFHARFQAGTVTFLE
ncbi:MAG: hypothetical protein ACRD2K_07245, partial [Terriglobales bacterium]